MLTFHYYTQFFNFNIGQKENFAGRIKVVKLKLPVRNRKRLKQVLSVVAVGVFAGFLYILYLSYRVTETQVTTLQIQAISLGDANKDITDTLIKNIEELNALKNEDQYKINLGLRQKVSNIERTYTKAVSTYEELLKLKDVSKDTKRFDDMYTTSLVLLSKQEYEEADKQLTGLAGSISDEREKIAASFTIPAKVTVSNDPPGAGYSRQQVNTDIGNYLVSLYAADLSNTKVIIDTATDGDCSNDCPVLPLAEYVSRNNAIAGVNGSYFCPASYPSCAGKTNSFDMLIMNKNKKYINSGNNVYSNNPAFIFGSGYARFVGQALEWGRDTGVDGVISNFPTLVQGGNLGFGGDDDPKKGSKGARSFVANKGSKVYMGVVFNVTVAESARVMHTMGMENALNLDSGGSTALWSGGYKVGPGRNLPNVVLFVRK